MDNMGIKLEEVRNQVHLNSKRLQSVSEKSNSNHIRSFSKNPINEDTNSTEYLKYFVEDMKDSIDKLRFGRRCK